MRSPMIGMELARARAKDLAAQGAAGDGRPRRERVRRPRRVRSALGSVLVGAGTRLLHEGGR